MRTAARHVVLLAILALPIGHASLAVHAASHPLAEAADCELCMSYGDVSPADTAVAESGDAPRSIQPANLDAGADPARADVIPYFQRGPPFRH